MSAPLPPGINAGAPAAPAPAGGGSPVPLGDVLIRALPERLSGLDRAVSISGTVVAQEDGTATLRTAAGDVTVETPAPLPTDRPVTLRIPPQTPGTPPRAQASAPPVPQTPTPASDGPAQTAAPAATTAPATPPPAQHPARGDHHGPGGGCLAAPIPCPSPRQHVRHPGRGGGADGPARAGGGQHRHRTGPDASTDAPDHRHGHGHGHGATAPVRPCWATGIPRPRCTGHPAGRRRGGGDCPRPAITGCADRSRPKGRGGRPVTAPRPARAARTAGQGRRTDPGGYGPTGAAGPV